MFLDVWNAMLNFKYISVVWMGLAVMSAVIAYFRLTSMCEQAAEVTADVCEETGESPYVRFEFIPSGVVAKLRYRVDAVKRQITSTLIVERVSEAFMCENGIEFAYVKRDALLRSKDGTELPPQYLHLVGLHEQPITDRIR